MGERVNVSISLSGEGIPSRDGFRALLLDPQPWRTKVRAYRNREQLVSAGFSMKANDTTWLRKLRNRRRRAKRIRRGWR